MMVMVVVVPKSGRYDLDIGVVGYLLHRSLLLAYSETKLKRDEIDLAY